MDPRQVERMEASDDALREEIASLRAALAAAERERTTDLAALAEDAALMDMGGDVLTAITAKLREACGGSEPSGDHDYADEVIGLLRVTREQRDTQFALCREMTADRDALAVEVTALRARVEELTREREEAVAETQRWKQTAGRKELQSREYAVELMDLGARVEEYQRTCDSLREIARGAEADRDAALAERDRARDWSGNLEAERDRVFELLAEAGLWDRSRGGLVIGVQGVVDAVGEMRAVRDAARDLYWTAVETQRHEPALLARLGAALLAARALAGAKGEGGA